MRTLIAVLSIVTLLTGCKNTNNYITYNFDGDISTQADGNVPFIDSSIESVVEQASETDVTDNQADGTLDLTP
ncbi:MAG: hypothetical protein MI744_08180 [Pseudomonadales bacterium]|nr:hypothetical protein [Pseudomonadales bacterium]